MYGEGNRGGGFKPRGGYGGGSGGGYGGRSGGGDFGGGVSPVNVGDELDVRIEAVGEKGDGIARKRGFVLFVPNAKEGSEVRIRVTKVLRKVGFAEVIGQAQSTPPAADAPRAPRETASVQPIPQAPAPEDSEDFGEEPADAGHEDSDDLGDEDMEVPPVPEAPDDEGFGEEDDKEKS